MFVVFPFFAVAQNKGDYKKDNISIFAGVGVSSLSNSGIDSYFRLKMNPMLQTGCSHELNFSGINHSFAVELDMKVMASDFKFDDSQEGLVSQGTMGLNFLFNLKSKTKSSPVDFFLGPGVYTVLTQKRIPKNPSAGVTEIDDKYCSYSGLSLNSSVSFSVPVDNYRIGSALRVFYYPDVTFLNRDNTPEFNTMGVLVSAFIRFN